MASVALAGLLVGALLLQALLPRRRLLVVAAGAGLACLVGTLSGVTTTGEIFADVPWHVLTILVGLGLLSELIVSTRLFGALALGSTRLSRARPAAVLVLFALGMYLVSGLVNNLTAILFVLPVLLSVFRLLGVTRRYVSWTLGVILVACNLGGAASPIGDFPAILLLGSGRMGFGDYLLAAAPPTAAALLLILSLVLVFLRPARGLGDPLSSRLTLTVMGQLYRNVRVDRRLLLPLGVVVAAMLAAWTLVPASSGVGPDLICWIGVGLALFVRPATGERLLREKVDMEAPLFLLFLFVMVVAVGHAGLFRALAAALTGLPVPPVAQLILFLVVSGLLTGIFSAGPSMAALLEVAAALAVDLPPTAVYVGLALSVCAGSSLFLTAATSGPMTQILTERADLVDIDGQGVRFGFFDFLPVGILSFAVIQVTAVVFALVAVALSY